MLGLYAAASPCHAISIVRSCAHLPLSNFPVFLPKNVPSPKRTLRLCEEEPQHFREGMTNRCIACASASFMTPHSVVLLVLFLLAAGKTCADSRKESLKVFVREHAAESIINLVMAPVEFLVSPLLNAHATMLFVT